MILVPLLNPKFAIDLSAQYVRTSGSRHQWNARACPRCDRFDFAVKMR
jgi:hypothetical protein